jgi:Zn-dependent peptidase ImmA (M78 family)
MGEIITITDFFLYKRNMRMTTEKNQNIILDLHQKGSYDEMPANADKLLALFPESNYPVPVIGIAKELGFKVFEDDIEDEALSGMIAIDHSLNELFETDKIIIVNKKDSSEHKRFTIAHELAHYLFDADHNQDYYNTYQTNESSWSTDIDHTNREAVANYFAANLLMPALDFRKKYNKLLQEYGNTKTGKLQITSQLSSFFGVPQTAVQIRYKELQLE